MNYADRRFRIDGEDPCSLDEFRQANEEDEACEEMVKALTKLDLAETIVWDNGAGGPTTFERVL